MLISELRQAIKQASGNLYVTGRCMMAIQTATQPGGGFRLRYFAACVAFLLITGCVSEPDETIINRLYGTWETGAAAYEDARFKVSRESIVFYAVDGPVSLNRITDIRHFPDKKGDLLSIEYIDKQGQEYLLKVYLYSRPDGDTLVFKNQAHITWKKTADGQ